MKVRKASDVPHYDPDEIKDILVIEQLLDGVDTTPASNGELKCLCPLPGHEDDTDPSFNFGDQVFYCHGCNRGGDVIELYMLLHKVDFQTAMTQLAKMVDIQPVDDVFYDYHDVDGKLVYRKVRQPNKEFYWQRRENGNWVTGLDKQIPPLYKLPDLINNSTKAVFIAEGEKDVHTLSGSFGLIATWGGKKWDDNHTSYLKDRDVFIIPDNDDAGKVQTNKIATALYQVAKVRILYLPGLEEKEDVTNWYEKGGTRDQLLELAASAEVITQKPGMEIKVFSMEELLKNPDILKPPERVSRWLCHKGIVSLTVGPPIDGRKTTICASDAFHTLKTGKKVLWIWGYGDEQVDLLIQRFQTFGIHDSSNLFLNVNALKSWDEFDFYLDKHIPDVVYIDSLSSVLIQFGKLPDHGDGELWQALFANFSERAIEREIGINVIAHSKKGGAKGSVAVRGSSGIEAAADQRILVRELSKDSCRTYGLEFSEVSTYRILDSEGRVVTHPTLIHYNQTDRLYSDFQTSVKTGSREWLINKLRDPQIPLQDKTFNNLAKLAEPEGITIYKLRQLVQELGIVTEKGKPLVLPEIDEDKAF